MSRALIFSVLAVIGLGTAAFFFWPRTDKLDVTLPERKEARSEVIDGEGDIAVSDVTDSESLPPLTIPFREAMPRLRELAKQGSGKAQCRLAIEYQKCKQSLDRLASTESFARRAEAARADEELKGAMLVFGKSSLEADLAHCEGIEKMDAVEVAQLWRRSAMSGNREGMMRYASGAAFHMGNIVDLAGELQIYKRDAVVIAAKAASKGDGRAVIALASAYSPDNHVGAAPLLAQVAGEDVAESLALFMYADRAGIRPSENPEAIEKFIRTRIDALQLAASPEQIQWAERKARELATDWAVPQLPSGNDRISLANAQYAPPVAAACEQ